MHSFAPGAHDISTERLVMYIDSFLYRPSGVLTGANRPRSDLQKWREKCGLGRILDLFRALWIQVWMTLTHDMAERIMRLSASVKIPG